VIPLAYFTSNKKIMGSLANRSITTISSWIITFLIVALNVYLIYETFYGG